MGESTFSSKYTSVCCECPPKFDNDNTYKNWRKNIGMWCELPDLLRWRQTLALHLSLFSKARHASSEVSIDMENNAGVEILLEKLGGLFLLDKGCRELKMFRDLRNLRCTAISSIFEFKRVYFPFTKETLPDAVMVLMLLASCNLPEHQIQLVLLAIIKVTYDIKSIFKCGLGREIRLKFNFISRGVGVKSELLIDHDKSEKENTVLNALPLRYGKHDRALCVKDKHHRSVHWKANQKAWVPTTTFKDWFYNCFDRHMEQYRTIKYLPFRVLQPLQFVHLNDKVVFLPPKTTSLLQPMDQSVVAALKRYYTHRIMDVHRQDGKGLKDIWVDEIQDSHSSIERLSEEQLEELIQSSSADEGEDTGKGGKPLACLNEELLKDRNICDIFIHIDPFKERSLELALRPYKELQRVVRMPSQPSILHLTPACPSLSPSVLATSPSPAVPPTTPQLARASTSIGTTSDYLPEEREGWREPSGPNGTK